jgi:hypothetical protein
VRRMRFSWFRVLKGAFIFFLSIVFLDVKFGQ